MDKVMGGTFLKNSISYIVAFLAFWTILAERVTITSTIFGAMLATIIYIYVNESYKGINLLKSMKLIPIWITFLLQLIKEIIIANFQVAIIVLSKDMSIAPEVVEYKTELDSDLLKTILANSITLTPGTMTVDIEGDSLKIHCLNRNYAEALGNNAFEKTLLRIQEANHDK